MARIDKVTMIVRATAGTALTGVLGVRVGAGGSIFPSGTAAGDQAFGVVCLPGTIAAGSPVGVLKAGEIVEFGGTAAGTYYAGANGSVSTTSTNSAKVGQTLDGTRLVVLV